MKKPARTLVMVLTALTACGMLLAGFSNVFRTTGSARFVPMGKNHEAQPGTRNRLEAFGPWGWFCTTYGVTLGPDGSRQLAAMGLMVFPFVGPCVEVSSSFPSTGEIGAIEPDMDTVLFKSSGYEGHVMISRDRVLFDRLSAGQLPEARMGDL